MHGPTDEHVVRTIVIVCAVALLITGILTFTGCNPSYSEGTRSGIVNKLSYKGMVWKSWEGEMNLGGMVNDTSSNNGGVVANVWAFSVADQSLVKELEAAQRSGERVTLHYKQWLIGPVQYSTGYLIWKVEREKPEAPK